jgi:uncharacterized protein
VSFLSASEPPTVPPREWFAQPGERASANHSRDGTGLRFSCTLCGNCCSGPEGYVIVSDDEIAALAKRFAISFDECRSRFTREETVRGKAERSLIETPTPAHGGEPAHTPNSTFDCIFLDRTRIPGKAVCGVYEDRPEQCRTWPFWPSVLRSESSWTSAKRVCPGIDTGPIRGLVQIRIDRDRFAI